MRFARPGCCPACGTFVSVRTKHTYRCRPPVPPSQEVPYTGRSPMLAWPAEHRVQRGGSTWLRSPVPGIGPRLLVLLAQHRAHARRDLPNGKRARYGPSHALQDLLEVPPEEVLDEALRPLPAWVPCDGTWHRVLLWDGELWAMDHEDIDVEAEQVAAVLGNRPLTGCTAVLSDWAGRRTAVRLPWSDVLRSLDAAASWGVDELGERDCWIDAGVDAGHVAAAAEHGIGDVELLRWVPWERQVERVAAWRAIGWASADARALHGYGLTPEASAPWRAQGLDVGLVAEALLLEMTPGVAGEWRRAGYSLATADQLLLRGVGVEEARALRVVCGSTPAVLRALQAAS